MTTRTTQPLTAVGPDTSSALNVGLRLLYNPAAFQGDLLTNTAFTANTGSNVSISSNGATVGLQLADAKFAYWPGSLITDIGTGDYTVTMLVRPDSFSGFTDKIAFSTLQDDASDQSGIAFNLNDSSFGGGTQFGVEEGNLGTIHHSPSHVTLSAGTFYVLSARRRSSLTFVDVVVNGAYTTDGDPGKAFEGGSILLGANHGFGNPYGICTLAFLHIVKGALSDDQLLAIAANPWQVFNPLADQPGLPDSRPYTSVRYGGGVPPSIPAGLKSERGRPGPALRALQRFAESRIPLGAQNVVASAVTGNPASYYAQMRRQA